MGKRLISAQDLAEILGIGYKGALFYIQRHRLVVRERRKVKRHFVNYYYYEDYLAAEEYAKSYDGNKKNVSSKVTYSPLSISKSMLPCSVLWSKNE